jgi:hypothetical protein
MVSRAHFLIEFDLYLLTFVPRVRNGVQMGLRGIDESLFPIIAPRLLDEVHGELQRPTAIYTDGFVGFGIFLGDRDSYHFALIEGLKLTGISYRTNDILFRTKRPLRCLTEFGNDITLMWI